MKQFIGAAAFSIAVATTCSSVLAQDVQHAPLATSLDASKGLRLARPLSHHEEIALRPLDHFRECESCPEMIVIPAGRFLMGSGKGEAGSTSDESPQHLVNFVQPFSVGRFPITFSEWDACVAAKGCSYRPSDRNWGRGSQPVIGIQWDEAKEYVAWLSRTSGKTYRLLTEAEREYVARAGTTTAYWWGDRFEPTHANCAAGNAALSSASLDELSIPVVNRTVPVQSFQPNPWGLYQVHGNVYDWVEDCWNDSYDRAPSDGSAWLKENCSGHVLRGGAFSRIPETARSAARMWFGPSNRLIYMSVRVARTLKR
jgi:formylglycine-generating enzyme required for sulfatase activity